jgi:hypothetical protein
VEGVAESGVSALVWATDVGLAAARYGAEGFLEDDGTRAQGPVWHWVQVNAPALLRHPTCPELEAMARRTPRRLHRGEREGELWVEADESLSGGVEVGKLTWSSSQPFVEECLPQGFFLSTLQGDFCAACPDGSAPLHLSGSLPRTRCALPEGDDTRWASFLRQASGTSCTLSAETPQVLPGR